MPNSIKYSQSAQSFALKKGDFWVGTGDVGKGPTSTTDYWNGISPSGGYTIYLNKGSNGPAIYTVGNDAALISISNRIAGQTFETAAAALAWFATQTDKMVFNEDYPAIVTDGLVLNLDAGFTPSYPKTGTTWYDVSSSGSNGTLINGPTFNSANGDSIVFDGVDDYVTIAGATLNNGSTLEMWFKQTTNKQVELLKYGTGTIDTPGCHAVYYVPNTLRCLNFINGTRTFVSITHTINLGDSTWRQLLLSYTGDLTGGTASLYINGQLITSASATSINSSFDGPGFSSNSSYAFPGNVSTLRVYNRGLSATEALQNYNAQNYLGSAFNPASSAAAILAANPSAPDGYYWINTNLGARNLYCIMSQGGWMGMTSELCPQSANVSTSASWETNTSGRLQSSNTSILNVSVVETGCGGTSYYQLQSPSTRDLSYTQSMLLMQRISTIGQCSAIANGSNSGYYTGPEYTGSYTSYGMCTWGDGNFANACCDNAFTSNLKAYWVLLGSGTNPSLYYQVQCASGSGQHYHMWFIK